MKKEEALFYLCGPILPLFFPGEIMKWATRKASVVNELIRTDMPMYLNSKSMIRTNSSMGNMFGVKVIFHSVKILVQAENLA